MYIFFVFYTHTQIKRKRKRIEDENSLAYVQHSLVTKSKFRHCWRKNTPSDLIFTTLVLQLKIHTWISEGQEMQLAYLEKRHLWNHFYSYIIITKKRQVLNLHSHLKWSFQSYCIVPKTPWTRKHSWYLPPLSELWQNNINKATNNHIRIWWRWQSDYEIITQATIERQQTHTPRWI